MSKHILLLPPGVLEAVADQGSGRLLYRHGRPRRSRARRAKATRPNRQGRKVSLPDGAHVYPVLVSAGREETSARDLRERLPDGAAVVVGHLGDKDLWCPGYVFIVMDQVLTVDMWREIKGAHLYALRGEVTAADRMMISLFSA